MKIIVWLLGIQDGTWVISYSILQLCRHIYIQFVVRGVITCFCERIFRLDWKYKKRNRHIGQRFSVIWNPGSRIRRYNIRMNISTTHTTHNNSTHRTAQDILALDLVILVCWSNAYNRRSTVAKCRHQIGIVGIISIFSRLRLPSRALSTTSPLLSPVFTSSLLN